MLLDKMRSHVGHIGSKKSGADISDPSSAQCHRPPHFACVGRASSGDGPWSQYSVNILCIMTERSIPPAVHVT
jgi:hypothetical protein